MKNNIKFLALTLGLLTSIIINSLLFNGNALAQSNSGQALEIGPTVITLSADPGETITSKITVRNVSSGDLIVRGEINDFISNGEDGTPKIIIDPTESKDNPYSIHSWISPLPEYTLVAKAIENMSIIINVPENATPGGYYGVIRFTSTPPELQGTGVSLSASIGSLLLLKVNGEVVEDTKIEQFYATKNNGDPKSLFEIKPIDFVVRVRNDGNIHETPTGQIAITDMFKNKIATVNVNLNKSNVLPNSIRKFTQTLDHTVIGDKMLFGKYKADLKLTYGSNKNQLVQSIEFWVIPYTMIIIFTIGLMSLFIALRITLKRYNEHIINKAMKSRKNKNFKN